MLTQKRAGLGVPEHSLCSTRHVASVGSSDRRYGEQGGVGGGADLFRGRS